MTHKKEDISDYGAGLLVGESNGVEDRIELDARIVQLEYQITRFREELKAANVHVKVVCKLLAAERARAEDAERSIEEYRATAVRDATRIQKLTMTLAADRAARQRAEADAQLHEYNYKQACKERERAEQERDVAREALRDCAPWILKDGTPCWCPGPPSRHQHRESNMPCVERRALLAQKKGEE